MPATIQKRSFLSGTMAPYFQPKKELLLNWLWSFNRHYLTDGNSDLFLAKLSSSTLT
jgi:hypothetical protein